jgi:hypothetical protein
VTPLDFLAKYIGAYLTAPGGDGGQCVDLVNLYIQMAHGTPHQFKNAIDWAGLAIPGWRWVSNSQSNFPKAGDLVVWGENAAIGTGPNGHIAVALAADSMHLLSMDQNWPDGSPTAMQLHSYIAVLGWQTPS